MAAKLHWTPNAIFVRRLCQRMHRRRIDPTAESRPLAQNRRKPEAGIELDPLRVGSTALFLVKDNASRWLLIDSSFT